MKKRNGKTNGIKADNEQKDKKCFDDKCVSDRPINVDENFQMEENENWKLQKTKKDILV
jgi:hypothetical protein